MSHNIAYHSSFSELVETINEGFRYETILVDNKLDVPKKYHHLNKDSAMWVVKKTKTAKWSDDIKTQLKSICKLYLNRQYGSF